MVSTSTEDTLGTLKLTMGKVEVNVLLDSAASQSFSNADLFAELQEGLQVLDEPLEFLIATGERMAVYGLLIGYTFHINNIRFSQGFLVGHTFSSHPSGRLVS